MSKINCLSPYFINHTATGVDKEFIELRLYIYTGEYGTNRPATPTYTLQSTPIDLEVSFEISDLVKDYFDVNYLDTKSMWVDYEIYEFNGSSYVYGYFVNLEGFYSYSYFDEGYNAQGLLDTTKPYRNLITYSGDLDRDWET